MKLNNFMRKISWKIAPFISLALFISPIVIVSILIPATGAAVLDGLFGIYTNTPFQAFIIQLSAILLIIGIVVSIIFSITYTIARNDLSSVKRSLTLSFPTIIVLILVIFFLVMESSGVAVF